MSILISIVVPIYNSEKYLEKCLDSILHQTYRNLELICVDDGSTDHSAEIVKQYALKDSRVSFYEKESKGVSAARNYALEKCRGEYVLFVDSDDWIDLDICSEALEIAENEKADVVIWSYIREYPDHSKPTYILGRQKQIYKDEAVRTLYRRMYGLVGDELSRPENANTLVTVWGKLYKKDKLQDVKFTDLKDIGTSEDTLFNIEVFQKLRKVVYIPKCAYHYRKNNYASITTKYNPDLYKQWENLYDRMEDTLRVNAKPAIYKEAFYNRVALGLVPFVLNVVVSETGVKKQNAEIKIVLFSERYQKAFANLQIKYMPIHWKIFFKFAKIKFSIGVLLLGKVMQFMRGR